MKNEAHMIIVKHEIELSNHLAALTDQYGMIFDIETTGFSPKFAYIYLIGMLYFDPETGTYILEQWMREKASDEYEMLFKFNQRLQTHSILYHFNGDNFDIPFISKRMGLYKLNLDTYNSNDLMKILRPLKSTLDLPNIKLKTIEAYFDYNRDDPFTGGELIGLYHTYLDTKEDALLKVLLLHNYEDILGLTKIIEHSDFYEQLLTFKQRKFSVNLIESNITNGKYIGVFEVKKSKNITINHTLFNLVISNRTATLTLDTTVDTLKYFFDQPSDYYYLPAEDYAVHKSIGKFVSSEHRVKATKENCYIKKEDFYLPSYKNFDLPVNIYYKQYKDIIGYISASDLVQTDSFNAYISCLLSLI